MKSKKILFACACSGAILLGLRVFALPDKAGDASTDNAATIENATSTEMAAEMRVKMDRAAANVRERLHMSAMLEVSDDSAEEAEIAELYRSGWIIEATVEEVEAALKAAAATPSLEDDIAAQILAHRASCRFFFKE